MIECNLGIKVNDIAHITYFPKETKKYKSLLRDKNINEILDEN